MMLNTWLLMILKFLQNFNEAFGTSINYDFKVFISSTKDGVSQYTHITQL